MMPLFSMEMDFKEHSMYAYIKEKLKSIQQNLAVWKNRGFAAPICSIGSFSWCSAFHFDWASRKKSSR